MPYTEGRLQFVQTPAAILRPQAMSFDEISRACPDIQSKVFPIIHEQRVQGIDLRGLTYRWEVTNPPSVDDEGDYLGSEPLDVTLDDRFAFHVWTAAWRSLPDSVQKRTLLHNSMAVDTDAVPTSGCQSNSSRCCACAPR